MCCNPNGTLDNKSCGTGYDSTGATVAGSYCSKRDWSDPEKAMFMCGKRIDICGNLVNSIPLPFDDAKDVRIPLGASTYSFSSSIECQWLIKAKCDAPGFKITEIAP